MGTSQAQSEPLTPRTDTITLLLSATSLCAYFASAVWFIIILSSMSIGREPTAQAGLDNLSQMRPYWLASAAMWVALTVFLVALYRLHALAAPRAGSLRAWIKPVLVIVLVAIALRVPIVLTHSPSISDDIWRFLFDGRTLQSGHNPYLIAPAEVDPQQPRFDGESELAAKTNNRDLVTIYLPTSQLVFAGAATITPEAMWHDLDRASAVYRGVFVAFELLAIVLLLVALRQAGRSPWWAILYAWHPLALTEVAASGHHDPVGYAIMVGALLLAHMAPTRTCTWPALLAFGGAVKPFPIPLAVIPLRTRPLRQWLIAAATGMVVCLALYLPFLATHDGEPLRRLWDTTQSFFWHWSFQGSVYSVLHEIGLTPENARRACLGMLAGVLVILYCARIDLWRSARVFLFAALLFSTTAHPWYLLWALVLIPMSFSPAVWVASLTLPWGYLVLGDVVEWSVPSWLGVITYLPVYAALLVDWFCIWRRRHAGGTQAVH
ncbi:MAG: hypothetical protein D8M59_15030 [Planctomycetes bacterium]|nr:hypothetical protein [Planctomycetota bacterium]